LKKDLPELRRRLLPTLGEEVRRVVDAQLSEDTESQVLKIIVDRVKTWHAPGILFLGDAAHTMSPSGGQGLNVAIRDTFVAANHLVPALQQGAPVDEALFQRIQAERQPEIDALQAGQVRAGQMVMKPVGVLHMMFTMLGLANAMLRHFSEKLPVSRWQRDLTDSTVMRNLGVALGHSLLAWRSALAGLERIDPDALRIGADLDAHWEVLGEAIQTVLRAHGVTGGYEKLKAFTRGRDVGQRELREFVATLGLPAAARERLESLTPAAYTGLAEALARSR
jgi:hypothetical protein